jgi:hypothetical protein
LVRVTPPRHDHGRGPTPSPGKSESSNHLAPAVPPSPWYKALGRIHSRLTTRARESSRLATVPLRAGRERIECHHCHRWTAPSSPLSAGDPIPGVRACAWVILGGRIRVRESSGNENSSLSLSSAADPHHHVDKRAFTPNRGMPGTFLFIMFLTSCSAVRFWS